MLEFFTIAAIAEHYRQKKQKEAKKLSEYFSGKDRQITLVVKKEPVNMKAVNLIAGIIALIVAILTARLAYDCNSRSNPALQILSMLFAFFFSGLYLLYYFLRYIIMGKKC